MALHNRSTISVEEYLQLDRNSLDVRYEYIEGYIRMLAGGSADHSTIAINIVALLRELLKVKGCRVYNSDVRVKLSEEHYVFPDATVTCDMRDRGKIDIIHSPRVVVEVLSPSTESYDRGRKFTYYRECPTIQEYMIVNTAYAAVEVCRREKQNFWSFHTYNIGDSIELTSLDVRPPVNAVYEDVEFLTDGDDSA